MEIIKPVLVWGIPLLAIYFFYHTKRELIQVNGVFQQLARDNRATVNRRTWLDYPSLTIHEQGFTFHLGTSLAPGGNVWVTRLNMAHRQSLDFTLRLQPHSRLEKMATTLGFQDAAIGNPPFNDSFLVKTNDATSARRFMTEEIQQALMRLAHHGPELAVTRSAIILTTSFLDRTDDLQDLVDFGRLLCRRLRTP